MHSTVHAIKQRFWVSVVIGLLVLACFTIPYATWGFDIDDCGMIWSSRFSTMQEFWALFIKGKNGVGLYFPSNYLSDLADCRPFLNTLHSFYRPLTLMLFGIQLNFFGANPYPYFFIMMLFHACNSVLLWYIVYTLQRSYLWATWAALFFAFHLSYWGWIGWIAAQPYTVSLCLLLLATISFVTYLKQGLQRYNIGACVLYGLSVFLFEFTFVFPIFISSLWFVSAHLQLPKTTWFSYTKKTVGLWLTAFLFLGVRHIVCASGSNTSVNVSSQLVNFLSWMTTRKADVISFLVDISNISFIPGGNQALKGSLILMIIMAFTYLFVHSKHKTLVLFCILNMVIFLWPALLKQYTLRYLYYALPFFCLGLALLLSELEQRLAYQWQRVCLISMCFGIIIANAYFVTLQLKDRQYELCMKADALNALITNPAIKGRVLCFVGLPKNPFASGLAQHVWMLGINRDLPIFYDPSTFVVQPTGVKNTDLSIIKTPNGFAATSHNKQQVWWPRFGGENMRLGKKIVLDQDEVGVYAFTYELNDAIVQLKPLFVTWDFEQNKFIIPA